MSRRHPRRSRGSALHIEGLGCLSPEEKRIGQRVAGQYTLRLSLGLVSSEQVQQAVVRAILAHRRARG